MPRDDSQFLYSLEIEVEMRLDLVRSSDPTEELAVPPAEWLFDPTEVEREEIGLGSLLGAIKAVEGHSEPDTDRGPGE